MAYKILKATDYRRMMAFSKFFMDNIILEYIWVRNEKQSFYWKNWMMEIMDKGFSAKMGADKGQLISKCPFGVFKSPKKELRKRSNQKNKGTLVTLYH